MTKKSLYTNGMSALHTTLSGIAVSLLVLVSSVTAASAGSVVGYVATVEGEAYAQAPGEEARRLECDSPIYRHDEITTMKGPGLAILSGDFYVRLAGESRMRFATRNSGAPDLDLSSGHLRMMDLGNGSAGAGFINTPGLELADTRTNSEALVFVEKISLVSMVCSRDHSIDATRLGKEGKADETLTSSSGECIVSKPREPIYLAAASHPQLGLLARDMCGAGLGVELASLADPFAPDDLASLLPPPVGAGPQGLEPPIVSGFDSIFTACTVGPSCQAQLPLLPATRRVIGPPPPPVP